MKKVLAGILIASLAVQLSAGTVLADTAASENETAAETQAVYETDVDYPSDWDADDPMNARAYEQIYGEKRSGVSARSAIPKDAIKTTWSTRSGANTFVHNDYNVQNCEIVTGIDVSYHNGSINWSKVKNDGIEYVILRAGYGGLSTGSLNKDSKFDSYIKGAQAVGLKVGVYFYSQATTKAKAVKEANYTLDIIKGYKLDMPVYFDYEDYPGSYLTKKNLSKSAKTACAAAYCDTIEAAGYEAQVYASSSWFCTELDGDKIGDKYGIWMARYFDSSVAFSYKSGEENRYGGKIDMWQCTSTAKVSGIKTNVDLNYWYKPLSISEAAHSKDAIRMKWNQVEDAAGYEVSYSKCRKNGAQIINIDDGSTTGYRLGNLSVGTEYYVKARAYFIGEDGTKTYGSWSSLTPMRTSNESYKRVKTKKELVMRKWAGTEYSKVTTIPKGVDFAITTVARDAGGNKWFKVNYSTSGKTYTGYVPTADVSTYVRKASGLKQSGSETSSITLKWSKRSEANGYELYRSSAKNGTYKKIKTITNNATLSYKNTGRSSGTEYFYKVRAYRIVNGKKKYGAFSDVKTLHTKAAKKLKVRTRYSVNMRKDAGTSYKVLKTVPAGKKFSVIYKTKDKTGKTWYKIKYKVKKKSYTGYILAKYAKKV